MVKHIDDKSREREKREVELRRAADKEAQALNSGGMPKPQQQGVGIAKVQARMKIQGELNKLEALVSTKVLAATAMLNELSAAMSDMPLEAWSCAHVS